MLPGYDLDAQLLAQVLYWVFWIISLIAVVFFIRLVMK